MFTKDTRVAKVLRQDYVDDSWYSKSGYVDTGNTYKGFLKAQSIDRTEELGSFGKVYRFHTDKWADIKEWDRLEIEWIEYDVKGVADFKGTSFGRTQVLLNKNE